MKTLTLTLTNDDGVLLDRWIIGIGECEVAVEDLTSEAEHNFYTEDNHPGDFGKEIWAAIEQEAAKYRVKVIIDEENWYLERIDSTHLRYSQNLGEGSVPVAHVDQLKDWAVGLYDELVKWLQGQPSTIEKMRWAKKI